MEYDILIDPDGTIRFIHSDELAETFEGEDMYTDRASNVEPVRGGRYGWVADMAPSCGPVLYADGIGLSMGDPHRLPFKTRQEALDAEREWLRENRGL